MQPQTAWKDRPLLAADSWNGVTVERRWLPDAEGRLTVCVAYTSVPHLTDGLGADGFAWGDTSPGSYDLALNVLEAALTDRGHRGPRTSAPDCFALAMILRPAFLREIIAELPLDGGHVSAEAINRWIDGQVSGLPAPTAALLSPRYGGKDADGSHWTRAEWEHLAGERLTLRGDDLVTHSGRTIATAVEPHPLSAHGWESHPL